MNTIQSAFLIVVLSVATISAQNPVIIAEHAEAVGPSGLGDATRDKLGPVYGLRSCGGLGKLLEWSIDSCDTIDSPCRFPADDIPRRNEIDFIPSQDIQQLGFRLILIFEGKSPEIVFDKPIPNSNVTGGVQHTKVSNGGVAKEYQGKNVIAQYILYRASEEGNPIEICAEADFILV